MDQKKETNKNTYPYSFGMGGVFPSMLMGGMMPGGFGMGQPMMLQKQDMVEEDKLNHILNSVFYIQMQQQQILKVLALSAMQSEQKINPMAFQMMGTGFGMGFYNPFGF